ncbi:MAG: hypothetical protein WC566_10190 [Dehalococcoidia bacterium]
MDDVRILVENPVGPCISIYMPAHRAGEQIRQDPIRLKNLVREAQVRLVDMGLSSAEILALLEPINKLFKRTFFWRHQSDGLALFSAAGLFRCYRVPLSFEELVVVTRRFHVKPLLALLASDGRFYVLALSQNRVRLLECTRYTAAEVVIKNVPKSLADILHNGYDRDLQLHTAAPVKKGERSAVFHGHGSGADDSKPNILKYFHRIDSGLSKSLHNEEAPLILAGVDYLLPIYAKANTYNYLMEDGVKGNPDELSNDELRRRAWAIAEPYFIKARTQAVARYQELSGTDKATNNLTEVVPASYHGRIDTLFVAVGVQAWGTFDQEKSRAILHQEAQPGDQDLLDFSAIYTLLNSGDVFALAPEEVPDHAISAAVFRY